MKLLDVLQGKWLGHPLHPAIVHVPLGLWLIACVLDVITWFVGGPPVLARVAFYSVLVGLLAALLAVPTGAADWAPIKPEKPAWKIGLYHLMLNLVATVTWAINFGLRLLADEGSAITLPILLTSLAGAALVFVGGYLGSLMAFDRGTSVGRQSKKQWRERAVRAGSRVPDES